MLKIFQYKVWEVVKTLIEIWHVVKIKIQSLKRFKILNANSETL